MKLSVIIPSRPAEPTLPRTLESVKAAAAGLDVEIIVIEDRELRGLPWARNQGLDRATGDVVFFVDADDTVKRTYFSRLVEVLEDAQADFALSSFECAPLKRDYDLVGNANIRAVMLPAFFGYSLDDVRVWNRGGAINARREVGGVCRCAFRRSFLERHAIRFDEALRLYEDAPFIAECAARAERVASTSEVLYNYVPGENGIIATSVGTDRHWAYKPLALKNRQAIAARVGGDAMRQFEGSAVFSLLELLKARRDWRGYLADPFVKSSLRRFPLSPRHPLVALGVLFLRCFA